ncbi:27361_t:CDS:1 [Dentiscutata erythropus]|uniref:27361_t:CDS:1 n=1 Tax=Dentiscutata erythropus TaxID=1348616 RepID=A0A9N9GMA6_9GLOM|nr:27361_t:CDS:1 [Dentiscutata erythropus]
MALVSDNRGTSMEFSSEKVYCEDCDKSRSNGDNIIENQESFDYRKCSKETLVKLPFPPGLNPKDLVNDLLNSKAKSPKMLNEFFIYRKVFVQELRKQNLKLKMTKASKLASSSWYQEPSKVKNEYRRIAREVEKEYNFARSEKLRTQKANDQHKHFTAPVNSSTHVNFDVTSNDDKIEPFTPIVVKPCTPLVPSTPAIPTINTNAWLHNVQPILTFNPYTPNVFMPGHYTPNVFMPGHDGNMYLPDISFQFQANNLKSYGNNLQDNNVNSNVTNFTNFTPQTFSIEEPFANYFDPIYFDPIYYSAEYEMVSNEASFIYSTQY